MSVPPASMPLLRPTQRVLMWARLALACHALMFNLYRLDHVRHPLVLIACSVLMLLWTGVMAWWGRLPSRLRRCVLAADIALALLLVLSTGWVVGPQEVPGSFYATTVYYHAAAALAAAVDWGSWAGLLTGIGLGGACLLVVHHIDDSHAWSSSFGICLVAWGAGQMVDQLRKAITERDRSLAASVALGERDRMNRIVHDGALQVLSLVEREGVELGPRGERLAQLARQQEIALRNVLQDRSVEAEREDGPEDVDIAAMLDAMSSERVTVSLMAGAVMLPAETAMELKAAVAQILRNTELHAGPEAESWMLLEDEGKKLVLSVRDNGVGMTREQIQTAFEAGRLGIRQSIIGRIQDIGGRAEVHSTPGRGVEWELVIPLPPREPNTPEQE